MFLPQGKLTGTYRRVTESSSGTCTESGKPVSNKLPGSSTGIGFGSSQGVSMYDPTHSGWVEILYLGARFKGTRSCGGSFSEPSSPGSIAAFPYNELGLKLKFSKGRKSQRLYKWKGRDVIKKVRNEGGISYDEKAVWTFNLTLRRVR